MELLARIQDDVKDGMRARDTNRVTQLRMFVAALQNEAKAKQRDLTEAEELAILTREKKKRIEAAEMFDQGGADEKAAAEREQIDMLDAYLPKQLSNDEIEAMVVAAIADTGASGPAGMGLVMKALKEQTAGRADGKVVSEAVKAALSAG
ncbi:MAG: GatB/YqeY domain-containing protein [Thermoleophilia bacterium]|nr:GatB/YqeY domain-containing protein [Thermoleophilia bacterium]